MIDLKPKNHDQICDKLRLIGHKWLYWLHFWNGKLFVHMWITPDVFFLWTLMLNQIWYFENKWKIRRNWTVNFVNVFRFYWFLFPCCFASQNIYYIFVSFIHAIVAYIVAKIVNWIFNRMDYTFIKGFHGSSLVYLHDEKHLFYHTYKQTKIDRTENIEHTTELTLRCILLMVLSKHTKNITAIQRNYISLFCMNFWYFSNILWLLYLTFLIIYLKFFVAFVGIFEKITFLLFKKNRDRSSTISDVNELFSFLSCDFDAVVYSKIICSWFGW